MEELRTVVIYYCVGPKDFVIIYYYVGNKVVCHNVLLIKYKLPSSAQRLRYFVLYVFDRNPLIQNEVRVAER